MAFDYLNKISLKSDWQMIIEGCLIYLSTSKTYISPTQGMEAFP